MIDPAEETEAVRTIDAVLAAVSEEFEVLAAEIMGRRRTARIADARMVVYWLAWFAGESYSAIGRRLGRDHSTVIAGVRRINTRMRTDVELLDAVNRAGKRSAVLAAEIEGRRSIER